MKIKYCMICWIFVMVLQSCMYIPTPQHDLLSGRGMIGNEGIKGLQIGTTTCEDILLQFGEPDLTLKRQAIFAYQWTRTRGYLFVAGPYYADVAPVGKTTLLMFEFDSQDLLERFEYISVGIFESSMEAAMKWTINENP